MTVAPPSPLKNRAELWCLSTPCAVPAPPTDLCRAPALTTLLQSHTRPLAHPSPHRRPPLIYRRPHHTYTQTQHCQSNSSSHFSSHSSTFCPPPHPPPPPHIIFTSHNHLQCPTPIPRRRFPPWRSVFSSPKFQSQHLNPPQNNQHNLQNKNINLTHLQHPSTFPGNLAHPPHTT